MVALAKQFQKMYDNTIFVLIEARGTYPYLKVVDLVHVRELQLYRNVRLQM